MITLEYQSGWLCKSHHVLRMSTKCQPNFVTWVLPLCCWLRGASVFYANEQSPRPLANLEGFLAGAVEKAQLYLCSHVAGETSSQQFLSFQKIAGKMPRDGWVAQRALGPSKADRFLRSRIVLFGLAVNTCSFSGFALLAL